jgi:hypothetical protein
MVADSVFLGDMVSTGRPCPWSGWWVCAHESRIVGGRRRHFEKGQLMPPVALVPDAPWWRRLLRKQPARLASTVWTLVEYDEQGVTLPMPVIEALEFAEAT